MFIGPLEKRCKYYYQLEPFLGSCDKATRLDGANSAEPAVGASAMETLGLIPQRKRKKTDAAAITIDITEQARDEDEHSVHSNEAYHRGHADVLDVNAEDALTNDDIRRIITDDDLDTRESSLYLCFNLIWFLMRACLSLCPPRIS